MSNDTPPSAPPGWYPDPNEEGAQRYWDGEAWTGTDRRGVSPAPEAAPIGAAAPSETASDPAAAPVMPAPGRLGCFGIGCISIVAIVLLVMIITAIGGAIKSGSSGSSGSGSPGTSSDSSGTSSGSSSDPIEQARAVLAQNFGESYTYDQVKSATDSALLATGESVSNDMRSRAWSAVLAVVKEPELSGVSPMAIMQCVAREGSGAGDAGMSFPDMAAICAVLLK